MDARILDFSGPNNPILPEGFIARQMIYACGDGYGGFDKDPNYKSTTNIEAFAELGFNVFCCLQRDDANIEYLTSHPELNVVLCITTGISDVDFPILEQLFPKSLDLISTDDTRFYPSAKTAFAMLKMGGICDRVSRVYIIKGAVLSGRVYEGDFQWGMPNFSIEKIEPTRRIVTLKKVGTRFNAGAKYADTMPNNTSHNENIARRLQLTYANKNAAANRGWANWRTRRAERESKKGGMRRCHSRRSRRIR